ncbi:Bax inhibitor-1/YccA family protein [Listeria welshimeri]|uniref:Bax inhibitor-1/YccA family protein n=1 Tax=Listeria welshimeri TaxID=1643 RepID=A0A7X0T9S4_LISWE|nr:Bax inhibitor-1/YccA family protein [Listeria welshimeri]MBC1250775.1 Bax inhibitor-1/YccA family protein [Listeria welshimeri]MBC1289572.1 Bax inhibitor-1/YccA family protein [Listeria welshimeri]MBC1319553.1 Bax inhibitor-1/YccA family protein [Listeria welshimeri]MBC1323901.1 Bax inhibitor-1/YccA family protein [Listeria welshimeri]MBC1341721.1 Bax inhibitor-1/YccA family protein [Listeria welshimeri]
MNEINHATEQVNTEKRTSKQIIMQKILNWFVFSLLLASVGAAIGSELSPELYLPLVIIEIALLIASILVRRSKSINKIVGYPLLLAFAFVTGLTLGPTLTYYFGAGQGAAVLMAFVTAAVTFTTLAFVGAKMKKDLSFMSSALFAAIIILVIFSFLGVFLPLGSMLTTIISAGGTIIFSLYILYDFNQIMKRDVELADVPMLALTLYLDFLNLFMFLLRLFTGRN